MKKRKQKSLLKLEAKISKDVFMLFFALNALGYNDENNDMGMHPVRKKVRNILKKYNWNQKYPYFEKIFKRVDPWYFLYALFEKNNNRKIKISNKRFLLEFKKISKEPLIEKLWKDFENHYLKEIKKTFPLFEKETIRLIELINKSPKQLKKVILVVNLLDAYWRGYGMKIRETAYIIVGPGAEKNQGELIRHELLHVLAPQYHIPLRLVSEKDHRHATSLGYVGQNIIRREYIILSLNLIYKSEILKKDIAQDIIREKRYFPHLQEVMEIIKKQLKK